MSTTSIIKTIDGVSYEVHALRLRDVEDLMGREVGNFSVELLKRAVHVNGAPIGDAAADLPVRAYLPLAKLVTELNAAAEDDPKNE